MVFNEDLTVKFNINFPDFEEYEWHDMFVNNNNDDIIINYASTVSFETIIIIYDSDGVLTGMDVNINNNFVVIRNVVQYLIIWEP